MTISLWSANAGSDGNWAAALRLWRRRRRVRRRGSDLDVVGLDRKFRHHEYLGEQEPIGRGVVDAGGDVCAFSADGGHGVAARNKIVDRTRRQQWKRLGQRFGGNGQRRVGCNGQGLELRRHPEKLGPLRTRLRGGFEALLERRTRLSRTSTSTVRYSAACSEARPSTSVGSHRAATTSAATATTTVTTSGQRERRVCVFELESGSAAQSAGGGGFGVALQVSDRVGDVLRDGPGGVRGSDG